MISQSIITDITLAVSFMADESSRGGKVASIFHQALRSNLILSICIGLVVFFAANELSIRLIGDYGHTIFFQVLAVDIVFYAGLLPTSVAAILGLQKFKVSASFGVINALLRQSLTVLFIILMHNFLGLIVAWVVADLVSALVYLAYLLMSLGAPSYEFPLGKLIHFSWPLCVSNTLSYGHMWFDRVLLLLFVPLSTLGVYNVVLIVFGVLADLTAAVSTTLLPIYSALQGSDERGNLSEATRLGTRYVALCVIPLALGLLALSKPAIVLLAGQSYVAGAGPLMLLAGVFALTSFGTALMPLLVALAETRVISWITSSSLAISVIVAFVLMPQWGIVGAAVARAVSMILVAGFVMLILSRKVKLHVDIGAIWKSLVAGAIMASVIVLVQIPFYSKFLLPLYAVLGVSVYLVTLRALRGLRQDDIDLLRGYLGHRFAFIADLLSRVLV